MNLIISNSVKLIFPQKVCKASCRVSTLMMKTHVLIWRMFNSTSKASSLFKRASLFRRVLLEKLQNWRENCIHLAGYDIHRLLTPSKQPHGHTSQFGHFAITSSDLDAKSKPSSSSSRSRRASFCSDLKKATVHSEQHSVCAF